MEIFAVIMSNQLINNVAAMTEAQIKLWCLRREAKAIDCVRNAINSSSEKKCSRAEL